MKIICSHSFKPHSNIRSWNTLRISFPVTSGYNDTKSFIIFNEMLFPIKKSNVVTETAIILRESRRLSCNNNKNRIILLSSLSVANSKQGQGYCFLFV